MKVIGIYRQAPVAMKYSVITIYIYYLLFY